MNSSVDVARRIAFAPTISKKSESAELPFLNKEILSRIYRIATSVFFFVAGLTFATWASRIPDIQNKLQLSDAGLGGVLFALPAGLMTSLPLSGWLVGRFGSRKLVIIGAILYPLTLILLGVAGSIWVLTLGLFLFGLFANVINIAMNTQAVGIEKLYGKSIMASFHGLWSLAGFSGAAIGTLFVSAGFSPLFHFSLIILLAGLLVLISYRFTLPHDDAVDKAQTSFVKPDKQILILGIIAFCCLLCEGAMADWSGVYFKKVVLAPVSLTTLGYLAFTGTMALGRFLGDGMVMKIGVKRMLQLSGVLITTGLLISVIFPYLVSATIGFFLVGFGVSSVVPIVYGIAGRSKTMSASTALATVSTIGFLGFLIGPPIIGFVAEAINLRWSFALIAILGFGTAFLTRIMKTE